MKQRMTIELVRVEIVYSENVDRAVLPPLQMFSDLLNFMGCWNPPPSELLGPLVMNNVIVRSPKSKIRSAGDNLPTQGTIAFH
jgi:hypothetical protein